MGRFVFWETPPAALAAAAPLYADLAALQMRLALIKLARKYNPAQPRVPAGNSDGGQWTDAGGGGWVRVAANDRGEGEIATDASPRPGDQTLNLTPSERETARKALILQGSGGAFHVTSNPQANSAAPWYEDQSKSTVAVFNDGINFAAAEHGVDPDLIRAVMYVETTHGWYDEFTQPLGVNDTILPMNVSVRNWGPALGLSRQDLELPFTNIEAGTKILKGIIANLPDGAPVSAVATLYNSLGATKVTNYGARVAAVYQAKPW